MRFGVLVRSVLFWALGTAVPVVGLILSAVSALAFQDVPATQLATIMITVGLTLTLVRALAGSLAASVIVHFGYNGLIFGLIFLQTHGFRKFAP